MTEKELCDKLGIPLSEVPHKERIRELMAWRNEWKLYHRTCDKSGEKIISAYAPDAPFKVYKNEIWWGDGWDALDHGRDYDFSRPFFEQFADLQKVVPREGTSVFNSENCDYNSHVRMSKNCYLNSLAVEGENVMYSYWMVKDTDVVDSSYTNNSTLGYECTHGEKLYNTIMVEESNNTSDSAFCYQVRGCDHCMFSSNIANKSYYLFNKPCTKEEFEEAKKKYLNGSYTSWKEAIAQFADIKKSTIRRAANNINCENVTGDHMFNSRNCENAFEGKDSEDVYNSVSTGDSKDLYSIYSAGWPRCELIYYSSVSRGCTDCRFCYYCWHSNDLTYCDSCSSCTSCFGCIGLRHKKYCILNKQYTKEEYEALMPKIMEHLRTTGELGKFFPHSLSTFAYNETSANNFYPLSKEEALAGGWKWREKEKQDYLPATIPALPENIKDAPETITKEILACESCTKNYKIIPQEFSFYQKMNLPLPRFCPTCRHTRRLSLDNPLELFNDTCPKCQMQIQTSYPPNHAETVYCDACYLEAMN